MSSELIHRAAGYAACAHRTQKRKYTGHPYIIHPMRVAKTLMEHGLPEFVQAAAILHDVVEDCGVTVEEITNEFGSNIATLVYQVTDQFTKDRFPWFNREERKRMERERLCLVHHYAQSIKVADLIDNTNDIVAHDKGFAKVYLKEKAALLPLLIKAHPPLLAQAQAQLESLAHEV